MAQNFVLRYGETGTACLQIKWFSPCSEVGKNYKFIIKLLIEPFLGIISTIYLSIYLPLYPFVYLWLYSSLLGLGRFFNFLIFYTVGRSPWTEDQPVARPLPAHRTAQKQNKRTQISMRQVGFEPTIPVCEQAKRIHALDRAATVIGHNFQGAENRYDITPMSSVETSRNPLFPTN
jgi:hypothetical protein